MHTRGLPSTPSITLEATGAHAVGTTTIERAVPGERLPRCELYLRASRELIARHELVAIRIGRARRIPESVLDAWIAQQITDQGGVPWHTADSTTPAGGGRSGRHG